MSKQNEKQIWLVNIKDHAAYLKKPQKRNNFPSLHDNAIEETI